MNTIILTMISMIITFRFWIHGGDLVPLFFGVIWTWFIFANKPLLLTVLSRERTGERATSERISHCGLRPRPYKADCMLTAVFFQLWQIIHRNPAEYWQSEILVVYYYRTWGSTFGTDSFPAADYEMTPRDGIQSQWRLFGFQPCWAEQLIVLRQSEWSENLPGAVRIRTVHNSRIRQQTKIC